MVRTFALSLVLCGCFEDPGGVTDDDDEASTGGTGSSTAPSTTMSSTSATSMSSTEASTTDGTSSDPTSAESETGTSACPVGAVERPDVFAGWEGPIVLTSAGGPGLPPPCPPELGEDGAVGVGPTAQDCECTCQPTCRFDERDSSSCVGVGGVAQGLLQPGCNNLNAPAFVDYYTASAGQAVGDCATPVPVPSEPSWEASFRVCVAPVDAECVPRPPGAIGPCIRRDGDVECPLPTAEKHVVYRDPPVICGGCETCEFEALNACAADSIIGYTELDCEGEMTMAFPDCSPVAVLSLEYAPPIPLCSSAAAMFGELQPITYCCTGS